MNDLKLLALDCSAAAASVALYEDGELLGERYLRVPATHSVTLLPMAEELLASCHTAPAEIGLYAVSRGPGSFTGLRIGIAAVKGMAFPRNTPCLGVSTLEALAYNLRGLDGTAVSVMDARCGQVYAALFSLSEGMVSRITEDEAIPIDELRHRLDESEGPLWLVGDGARITKKALAADYPDLMLAPEPLLYERATGVAAAAFTHRDEAVPPARLLPSYLRPVHAMTMAEREAKKANS